MYKSKNKRKGLEWIHNTTHAHIHIKLLGKWKCATQDNVCLPRYSPKRFKCRCALDQLYVVVILIIFVTDLHLFVSWNKKKSWRWLEEGHWTSPSELILTRHIFVCVNIIKSLSNLKKKTLCTLRVFDSLVNYKLFWNVNPKNIDRCIRKTKFSYKVFCLYIRK